MKINEFKKSFTLLELLVVIGMLAILISLSMVAYSSVQKRARDSKRKTDLQSIQKMMEQCYSANNFSYPTDISGEGTSELSVSCPVVAIGTFTITDPASQTFSVSSDEDSYIIYVNLESSGTGATFSVTNQQ